jgi:hypothetical protein
MTNQKHPITPPSELVQQWVDQLLPQGSMKAFNVAAQWGADQELKACCEWLDEGFGDVGNFPATLRSERRPKPKPPSKEEALDELYISFDRGYLKKEAADIIRRALEQLDD